MLIEGTYRQFPLDCHLDDVEYDDEMKGRMICVVAARMSMLPMDYPLYCHHYHHDHRHYDDVDDDGGGACVETPSSVRLLPYSFLLFPVLMA